MNVVQRIRYLFREQGLEVAIGIQAKRNYYFRGWIFLFNVLLVAVYKALDTNTGMRGEKVTDICKYFSFLKKVKCNY